MRAVFSQEQEPVRAVPQEQELSRLRQVVLAAQGQVLRVLRSQAEQVEREFQGRLPQPEPQPSRVPQGVLP